MSITFSGRHDTFEVHCEQCRSELEQESVNDGMLSGKRVTCIECGADGLVYDDGGIWKMIDADSALEIAVK